METCLLAELERTFKKCSDCGLHPDYVFLLNQLNHMELTRELVDYLCEKCTSKKHIWEIRFDHLRILLRNPSSQPFDLKDFYCQNLKRSRRLAMKLFYIRGYAIYASEEELNPVMEKFCNNLEKNHDYIDYNYILSAAGLPYLAETYGYRCFTQALDKAREEHQKINAAFRGLFTLNEKLEQVNLITPQEAARRMQAFLEKRRNAKDS